ncbi:hypothetical protein FOZ60_010391 [Perkinsus olseni]|uniref:Uncharacterized protein n=1 Tax=Perkinsus olseni TaxID=32597 RepID=A0A7J6NFM2_PEROL|nr:hypothetical protein FOZ60_010391 [Perkinsus olseni]
MTPELMFLLSHQCRQRLISLYPRQGRGSSAILGSKSAMFVKDTFLLALNYLSTRGTYALTFLLALRLAFSASTGTSTMMSLSTVYLTLNIVKYGTASNVDATFTCTDTDSTSRDQLPLWEAASRKGSKARAPL